MAYSDHCLPEILLVKSCLFQTIRYDNISRNNYPMSISVVPFFYNELLIIPGN